MTEIENVSDTALWVAIYRAKESNRPDALFHDPMATILAGERGREIAKSMAHSKIMEWVMVVRTVAIDRLIFKAIEDGSDAILNLGAGLDTRPYRMKLPPGLRWIEVDFPHMIELKNQKLGREVPSCRLERISLDLSHREKRQALFSKLSAESEKVTIITEGVIPYLTSDQTAELAQDLFMPRNFEYWIQDYRHGGYVNTMPRSWIKNRLKAAPFQFHTEDWFVFFKKYGWIEKENILAFKEAQRIGRPVPFIFPWSLLFRLMPRKKMEKLRDSSGYVTLKRSS